MLEIIAIWALCKKVATIVKSKGRSSGGYVALTIVLWVGGEVVGALIGGAIAYATDAGNCVVYLVALAGAAVGGGIAYLIANSASDISPPYKPLPEPAPLPMAPPPYLPPVEPQQASPIAEPESGRCPSCGDIVLPEDQFCGSCGTALK